MKRLQFSTLTFFSCFCFLMAGTARVNGQSAGPTQSLDDVRSTFSGSDRNLATTILADSRLDTIQERALRLLHGFNAGTSYGEVWIRDFNTFIDGSMQVQPPAKVKQMLLLFFKLQGDDGDIVDGFIDSTKTTVDYKFRYSPLAPGWAAHKNTVETDQESSLIQAMRKYIEATGDTAVLREVVGGETVLSRMEALAAQTSVGPVPIASTTGPVSAYPIGMPPIVPSQSHAPTRAIFSGRMWLCRAVSHAVTKIPTAKPSPA